MITCGRTKGFETKPDAANMNTENLKLRRLERLPFEGASTPHIREGKQTRFSLFKQNILAHVIRHRG